MYNCLLGCLLWFMQPAVLIEAITAPRMRVSLPCILLIAITSDQADAVFHIPLYYWIYAYAAACLYYAAVCLYYACIVLLHACIMLLYAGNMLLAYYVDMMYGCSLFVTHTAYSLHSLRGVSFGVCDTHGHAWARLGTSLRGGCYSPFCMRRVLGLHSTTWPGAWP